MSLVASYDPDQVAQSREAAIVEAAFQIYWRFVQVDEPTARKRFGKLVQQRREQWEGDAEAAFRIFEAYSKGESQ